MNALKTKWLQGGRGSLNVLVYSLIVVAVLLSGIAVWQRYPQGLQTEAGDALEQRIGALMPNLGLIENWAPVGGLPQGLAATPYCGFVCPQCKSSVWTQARRVSSLCPFCSVTMARMGPDQQALGRQGARVSLVGV